MTREAQAGKQALLGRLARAGGQLRAVQEMIGADEDSERVAQQLAAVRKALDRAFYDLLAGALKREWPAESAAGRKSARHIERVCDLLRRYG